MRLKTNPIFLLSGPAADGAYLLGDYAWSDAVRLETAHLIAAPPGAGTATFTLEIAGVATEKIFTLGLSELPSARQSLALNLSVPAGQSVRWRIAFSGDIADAPAQVAITLSVRRETDIVVPEAPMTVWWRNGAEKFLLFVYDPATDTFAEATPGLATGRAAITDLAGVFTITVQGTPALLVTGAILYTNALLAGAGAPVDQPQLSFRIADVPIATLTKAGVLQVPSAQETAVVDAANQFALGVGAALNATGVVAEEFEQALP